MGGQICRSGGPRAWEKVWMRLCTFAKSFATRFQNASLICFFKRISGVMFLACIFSATTWTLGRSDHSRSLEFKRCNGIIEQCSGHTSALWSLKHVCCVNLVCTHSTLDTLFLFRDVGIFGSSHLYNLTSTPCKANAVSQGSCQFIRSHFILSSTASGRRRGKLRWKSIWHWEYQKKNAPLRNGHFWILLVYRRFFLITFLQKLLFTQCISIYIYVSS